MTNKAEILQSMKSGRRLAPAQARSEALGHLGYWLGVSGEVYLDGGGI